MSENKAVAEEAETEMMERVSREYKIQRIAGGRGSATV